MRRASRSILSRRSCPRALALLVDGYLRGGEVVVYGVVPNDSWCEPGGAFASAGYKLERVFWFAYSDAMVPPFGLTDTSWNPKPYVYERYRQLTGAASAGGGEEPMGEPPAEPPPAEPTPEQGPSCGDLAAQNGWSTSLCEWNGNGACGGQGTPTWDCDLCCGW